MTEHEMAEQRAERLTRRNRDGTVNHGYTKFVRVMRLALPVAAAVVILVVFLRMGGTEENIKAVDVQPDTPEIEKEDVARNELVNPKFVSVDHKNQPFEIVAERAVQGDGDKDLILLDQPVGKMTLSGGADVKMSSISGRYRQETEKFFLEGDVLLEHSDGYKLESSEAHIDMDKNFAWSEKDVVASGPDINIDAKGLSVNGQTGEIVFKGPAMLVFEGGVEGIE